MAAMARWQRRHHSEKIAAIRGDFAPGILRFHSDESHVARFSGARWLFKEVSMFKHHDPFTPPSGSYTRAAMSARPTYDSPHRSAIEAMLSSHRKGIDDFVTGQADGRLPEIENAVVPTHGHCGRPRPTENCHG